MAHPASGARHARPPTSHATVADRRPRCRQDPHAHPPHRPPARHRPGLRVGDRGRHVQRARGRRTAPAALRPARRAARPRRHRRDVSCRLRTDPARTRRRVRARASNGAVRARTRAPDADAASCATYARQPTSQCRSEPERSCLRSVEVSAGEEICTEASAFAA